MDHDRLRTASNYLNNLLLARGLLRNGDPIDFVKPSKDSRAQIINLVHDLILREDREKEQREGLAHTIQQLRAEDARKTHELERLATKGEESARAAVQAQAGERAAHVEVKKVEKAMKQLQDQAAKLKAALAQVKAQCTNDVRKRDLELARLKTHLQGQQRGNRSAMTAPTMTAKKPTTVNPSVHELGDPEYSLKQETTDFLTQLSQSLSDENDGLISLIRSALSTLRDLLGLPANARRHPDSALGSMDGQEDLHGKQKSGNNMMHTLATSYEALAEDMEATLSHLKTILTNPNFVPMEEVEVREEEIGRLREGWDHMEQRWRDILGMMQGWLAKMNTGESIDMDDLRQGMGLVSPERNSKQHLPNIAEQSFVDSEASEIKLSGVDGPSAITLSSPRRPSAGDNSPKRKRHPLEPPEFFDLRPRGTSSRSIPTSPPKSIRDSALASSGSGAAPLPPDEEDESEELEVPQMTIAEKLSAAQQEAEEATAARVDARDPEARASKRAPIPAYGLDGSLDAKDEDTLSQMPISPMGKRTKIRGRAKKRKSTLSPDELATLICADEE